MGKKLFDFVIGNPPYQEESAGDKPSDASVYHYFMDASYKVAEKCELITPARFLFNAGSTPSAWNKKILNDEHFKVLNYEPNSDNVFPGLSTPIKGGVAIHYRDDNKIFGSVNTFTVYPILNQIFKKVRGADKSTITDIIFNQNKFNLDELYKDYPHLKDIISSGGREKRMTSKCLEYECFNDNTDNYIKILGLSNNKRVYKYINPKYIDLTSENLKQYKVILPANNGSGELGEILSSPVIGEPNTGYTQTFIGFGAFPEKYLAENTMKYLKSKFCRLMHGVLKITQNGKKDTWKYVPLQDFTPNSDIDWSKSIHEIDMQLYKKYNLSSEEIEFIETHVKEMS